MVQIEAEGSQVRQPDVNIALDERLPDGGFLDLFTRFPGHFAKLFQTFHSI